MKAKTIQAPVADSNILAPDSAMYGREVGLAHPRQLGGFGEGGKAREETHSDSAFFFGGGGKWERPEDHRLR